MIAIQEPAGIFALVLAVAVLVPFLSDKIGIPVVASFTFIGILLGPQVLGLVQPSHSFQFIGSLGMIFIFLVSGYEIALGARVKARKSATLFGALSFVIPLIVGFLFGIVLYRQNLLSAVLMGVFFASAGTLFLSPTSKPTLSGKATFDSARFGISLSRIAVVFVLFLVEWKPLGNSWFQMLISIVLVLIYAAALFFGIPFLVRQFLRKIKIEGTLEAVFVLFLGYTSAYIGSLIGISPNIGAFYAGTLLAETVATSTTISSRLKFFGDSFFVPFLLIFIGASADFSAMISIPHILVLVLGSVIFGLLSKYLAVFLSGNALGYVGHDKRIVFGYSAFYGTFSLVIASVAGTAGKLNQPLLSGAILLVILSGSIASIISRSSGSALAAGQSAKEKQQPIQEKRIVIAMSKPSSARHLMELGMAIHGQKNQAPLFPLAVVSSSGDDVEERRSAETMLSAAVMQGVTAQMPVIPVTRMSVNIAQGILETAEAERANIIIIGWNKPPRLSNAFFGSVIDQVVTGGKEMVLVARTTTPFSASSHLVVIMPPFSDIHPGFTQTMESLREFVFKYQTKVHFISLNSYLLELAKAIKESPFTASFQTLGVDSWKDVSDKVRQSIPSSKTFMLISARPSEPAWHPTVERLPHRLGEEFPDSNLVMIYLASIESSERESISGVQTSSAESIPPAAIPDTTKEAERMMIGVSSEDSSLSILEKAVSSGRVRVNMDHTAIADGIFELVSSAFPFDKKKSSKLAAHFTEIVQKHPIEIEPGVVLLHDRVSGIASPIVCFGSHRQGFRISILDTPIQILILMFVPENQTAEDHLAFLGKIAQLFRDLSLGKRLIDSDFPEDLL
jgi:Kef-type K+ transport system membrane component KefB/mannitol/fructose-specific phosphotransferase system IIA component (Ntr-type)